MTDRDRLYRLLFAPQQEIDEAFEAIVVGGEAYRESSRIVWSAVWRMLRYGR